MYQATTFEAQFMKNLSKTGCVGKKRYFQKRSLYLLKKSENLWFSNVFKGYGNGTLG